MSKAPTEPRLSLNSHGVYEIRFFENGHTRRKSTASRDHKKASKYFSQWLHESGAEAGKAPSVEQVLSAYLKEKVAGKPSFRRSEHSAKIIIAEMGCVLIDRLDANAVAAYREGRRMRWICDATIRRELVTLVAAINHARNQCRIPSGIQIPSISLPPHSVPRSTFLDSNRLAVLQKTVLDECEGGDLSRIALFVWIASETAARRRSIEQLTWAQVGIDQMAIDFRDGERHEKKRRVRVPISDRLKPVFERAHRELKSHLVLFNDREIMPAWQALMNRMRKNDGSDFWLSVTPHDLRRTWATLAAMAGVSMWDIAGVLGDSLAVVTKHYAHYSPEHLRGAVNFARPA